MDSWRTHKYNCHLSPSLQWLRHTGTEHRSAWRALELRQSCAGDRSVCKTEYINTSVFVTENRSYRRELEIAPKRQKKEGEVCIYYIYIWECHNPALLEMRVQRAFFLKGWGSIQNPFHPFLGRTPSASSKKKHQNIKQKPWVGSR